MAVWKLLPVVCAGVALLPCQAQFRVQSAALATEADPDACTVSNPVSSFNATSREAFVRIVAAGFRPSDRIAIEWVDPQGQVAAAAPYDSLPPARRLCLLSQLPLAGFARAGGAWQVRVSVNGAPAWSQGFTLVAPQSPVAILSVQRRAVSESTSELELSARGYDSDTTVNIARYRRGSQWEYIYNALPESMSDGRLKLRLPSLLPAEYLVILRRGDGELSPPARFLVETGSRYQLPYAAEERWRITQGPYGSFSHFGRTLHAYDLAPGAGRFVRAMRPGVVVAKDLGYGQTPRLRIFGNYVSIDHGDGEWSHYAHLKTRTFRVRTGQRVEAGEPLAEVGTSGYSFGVHLHVQVTRGANISSPSIPFQFGAASPASHRQFTQAPRELWQGELTLAAWWSKVWTVPPGSRSLRLKLNNTRPQNEFALYLTTPDGRHIQAESATVQIENPQPGPWRVSVQAVKGDGESLPFSIEPALATAESPAVRRQSR